MKDRLNNKVDEAHLRLWNVGSVFVHEVAYFKPKLSFLVALLEVLCKYLLSPLKADIPRPSRVGNVGTVDDHLDQELIVFALSFELWTLKLLFETCLLLKVSGHVSA